MNNNSILKQIEGNKKNLSVNIQLLEKCNNISINDKNIIVSKKVYVKMYNGNMKIVPFYKDIIRLF